MLINIHLIDPYSAEDIISKNKVREYSSLVIICLFSSAYPWNPYPLVELIFISALLDEADKIHRPDVKNKIPQKK